MIRWLSSALRTKLSWYYHNKILDSMTEMEQFDDYVQKARPSVFLQYKEASLGKRLEFQSVVDEFSLNLRDIAFLDLGPGYGDALDICYEEGSKDIEFVDIEPFFFTYNRLKSFTRGYRIDNVTAQLNRLDTGKYDLIWAKGCTSADSFITGNRLLKIRKLPLPDWLDQLDRLASPTGRIIITPHWQNDSHKRNIEDVYHNSFTDTMQNYGYVILPPKKHRNREPEYPITFYKNFS
jgi:hypothetical protein